ncbi:F-box/kelch-repeat protein [Thalictrum thalictroides]|uniref:F-box/kelch-repeat protein n=1 Tax=Thalictrum thalictroides TaxID=46969 RepID=A0A7J6VEI6_THATH|nr:F-box/kelch-repeat protein [Thalictrum thalictroides]
MDYHPWKNRKRDHIKIWGSCNGIILLTTFRAEYIYLWNPYTGECKKIRQVDKNSLPVTHNSMYSIGYNAIAADYQIIHISTSDYSHAKVEVYSLKNPSWRRIQDIPYSISSTMEKFVNGALHWLATRLQTRQIVIIAYVLETEKFIEVPLPDSIDVNPVDLFVFENGTLDAYLCTIIHYKNAAKQQQTKVWIMKDGVTESWMELFHLDGNLLPICCIREGAEIVLHNYQQYFIYDTNDKSLRGGKEISSHMKTTYIESIVTLPI